MNEQRLVGPSPENMLPTRGAIGSGKPQYLLWWSDGMVIVEHPSSHVKMRYPMAVVRELMFAEDVPSS